MSVVMLIALLADVSAANPLNAYPTITAFTAGMDSSGSCVANPPGPAVQEGASIVGVRWSLSAAYNNTEYRVALYENAVDQGLTDAQATARTWTKDVPAAVNGPYSRWTSSWAYRLDIIRLADGAVIDTRTLAPVAVVFGQCSAPSGGGVPSGGSGTGAPV